jgi:hypothetical protein
MIPRRHFARLAAGLPAFLSFSIAAQIAQAQVIAWTGQVTVESGLFDCAAVGAQEIVVQGDVNLRHPRDVDVFGPGETIRVRCERLVFRPGSSLTSVSSLEMRISGAVSGPVQIRGERGAAGANADPTPDIWASRTGARGNDGRSGSNGRNALSSSWDYPLGRNADSGGSGDNGGRGADGARGSTGAHGSHGANGNHIRIFAGDFGPGTTVSITTRGGAGGLGGRGGRGENGGDGGTGGAGGEGGDGDPPNRKGARGGNGGNGGDGGRGGNGGQGGDGGNGGRGGDVIVGLRDGGAPPAEAPTIDVEGGRGGDPGRGGEQGTGGFGGQPGPGGDGGDGDRFVWGIGGGAGGRAGAPGRRGQDGLPGPMGTPGKDGERGRIGDGRWGVLPTELFRTLMTN